MPDHPRLSPEGYKQAIINTRAAIEQLDWQISSKLTTSYWTPFFFLDELPLLIDCFEKTHTAGEALELRQLVEERKRMRERLPQYRAEFQHFYPSLYWKWTQSKTEQARLSRIRQARLTTPRPSRSCRSAGNRKPTQAAGKVLQSNAAASCMALAPSRGLSITPATVEQNEQQERVIEQRTPAFLDCMRRANGLPPLPNGAPPK